MQGDPPIPEQPVPDEPTPGATGRDLLITGLPRSGTTLLTALLDNPPRSLALSEPPWQAAWRKRQRLDAEGFARLLRADFAAVRGRLSRGEAVADRRATDGGPLTNYLKDGQRAFELRERPAPALDEDFLLAMKWPAIYTAALPALVATGAFRIVALVRDPLAALRSWNASSFPIARGHLPAGEAYWPELAAVCRSDRPLLERQARIWELFARRYLAFAGRVTLLRYEDMVADPAALSRALGLAFAEVPVTPPSPGEDRPADATTEAAAQAASEAASGAVAALCPAARLLYPERYGP